MTRYFLAALGLSLAIGGGVITWQASRIDGLQVKLQTTRTELDRVRGMLAASEVARQTEREQASQDFAGQVEKCKDDISDASRAATARASLVCKPPANQLERNKALRAIAGEQK